MNPTFSDIQTLLDTLYANDPNIGYSPHLAFWQNTTRDAFVAIQTGSWGPGGSLVVLGNPEKSNLYLALAGITPFDGSTDRVADGGHLDHQQRSGVSDLQSRLGSHLG